MRYSGGPGGPIEEGVLHPESGLNPPPKVITAGVTVVVPPADAPTETWPLLSFPLSAMGIGRTGRRVIVQSPLGNVNAPVVSLIVTMIGEEKLPGPEMTLPPASLAVTETDPVDVCPGVNVPFTFTTTVAAVPLTVKLTANAAPLETCAEVVTDPRMFPAPLAASYSVNVNCGLPTTGATIATVQLRPPEEN